MQAKDELDIVRDVSARLESAGFRYMITGSMAMNYYAQPRMTRDVDLVVALLPADASRIAELFRQDYYVPEESIPAMIRDEYMFNLIHNETVIKVDVIVQKSAEYRQEEFARRQRVAIRDFDTWIVSKEDLILSKLAWTRDTPSDRQLDDVRNLLRTGCDREYIERWTHSLGVANLWQQLQP